MIETYKTPRHRLLKRVSTFYANFGVYCIQYIIWSGPRQCAGCCNRSGDYQPVPRKQSPETRRLSLPWRPRVNVSGSNSHTPTAPPPPLPTYTQLSSVPTCHITSSSWLVGLITIRTLRFKSHKDSWVSQLFSLLSQSLKYGTSIVEQIIHNAFKSRFKVRFHFVVNSFNLIQ